MSIVRLGGVLLLMPTLACGLLGCSGSDRNDPNAWYNKTVLENLAGRSNPPPDNTAARTDVAAAAAVGTLPLASDSAVPSVPGGAPPLGPVLPSELYRSETSCGAMVSRPGGSAAPADDIVLQMTECEVARHYGPPDKVELGALPNGVRSLTLTYLHVPRPRIFHFAAGRLVGIENLSVAPPPPRTRRAAPATR